MDFLKRYAVGEEVVVVVVVGRGVGGGGGGQCGKEAVNTRRG